LPDFPVGEPVGGQLRDLQLVRRQLVAGVRIPALAGLAGGAQFPAGAPCT